MSTRRYYKNVSRSVNGIINDKLTVLRDFGVVDDNNEDTIRDMLVKALEQYPTSDPEYIVDRTARPMIMQKLGA